MARKTMMDAVKRELEATLADTDFILLSAELSSSKNEETGESSSFVRVEVEVPKGKGAYSRCRFPVKIPDAILTITEAQIEEADYTVRFTGLAVSYIDSKWNIYFKAEDYEVSEM